MMKNYILFTLLTFFVVGCNKTETHCYYPQMELGTIKFMATQSNKAFSGALEIFPCENNTTTYFGNYHRNALSVFNPSCVINKGAITNWSYPLLLPLGTYNLIYWGVADTPVYSTSRVKALGLSLGVDMSTLFWSMALNADNVTYMPVLDQVMAVQEAKIGASGISVNLSRQVAGLNVVIKNSNGAPFDSSIVSFEVLVSGIAEKINAVSGAPENQTKTVRFSLTIDPADRKTADNVTAMLYPSIPAPTITVNIKLENGQVKSYTTNLKNAFEANSKQTVTILMADILSSDPSGSTFTVDSWLETSQTIDTPII